MVYYSWTKEQQGQFRSAVVYIEKADIFNREFHYELKETLPREHPAWKLDRWGLIMEVSAMDTGDFIRATQEAHEAARNSTCRFKIGMRA